MGAMQRLSSFCCQGNLSTAANGQVSCDIFLMKFQAGVIVVVRMESLSSFSVWQLHPYK